MKYINFTLQDTSGNVRHILEAQFLQCTEFAKYISLSRGPDTNGIQLSIADLRGVQKELSHSNFVKSDHLLF